MNGFYRFLFPFFIFIFIFSLCISFAGDYVRYIEDDYTNNNECDSSNLASGYMTVNWHNEMAAHGYTGSVTINDMGRRWITDSDKYLFGLDHTYIENKDIALITSHGNHVLKDNLRVFRFRLNTPFPLGQNKCMVFPRDWMYLGDDVSDDIEILHIISCHSMTVTNFSPGGRPHANTWRPVFGGIHQIHGFHGLAWSWQPLNSDYYRVARDGFSNAIAYEWVNELYETNIEWGGETKDQCPVAYTGRTTSEYASMLLSYETYSNRNDWGDIQDPSSFKRLYIDGCEPHGAPEM